VTDRQQTPAAPASADLLDRQHTVGSPVAPTAPADSSLPDPIQGVAAPSGDTASLDDQDEADRLRILEALERGDIDIDEALSRIEQKDAKGA